MAFTTQTKVRFADVDPAGIVFYPRYFEMLNAAVEDWFGQGLGMGFSAMHIDHRIGVPTVKLDVAFHAPSMLEEVLTITITPTSLGRTSCAFTAAFAGPGGDDRLTAQVVLVCMSLDAKRAVEWPDNIRAAIACDLVPAA